MIEFETLEDAQEWMYKEVDDSCIDNYRYAYLDDNEEMEAYWEIADEGCCGSFDQVVIIGGKHMFIGCNYGH